MFLILRSIGLTVLLSTIIFSQNNSYLELKIQDCIGIALSNNKQREISLKKISVSETQLTQSKSALYPQLDISSIAFIQDENQNFIQPPMTVTLPPIDIPMIGSLMLAPFEVPAQDIQLADNKSIISEAQLTYILFSGGKISSIINQAKLSVEMAKNDLNLTESEIVFNVKKTYYSVILAKNILDIAGEAVDRFEATYNLTESLYQTGSGTVTKIDYLKNKMSLESFKSMFATMKSNYQTALSGLKYYMGIPLTTEIMLAPYDFKTDVFETDELSLTESVLTSNQNIFKISNAIEIYKNKIDEAQSDYWPSLALVGNYHRWDNSYDYGMATPRNKNSWTVGIGLKMSLFNGFRTTGLVDQYEMEMESKKTQKSLIQDGLKMRLNRIVNEIKQAENKIKSSKEAMIASIENRDLNQRAYQNDIGPVKDFIEAQIFESIMRAQYQLALYEYSELKAKLDYLLGATD